MNQMFKSSRQQRSVSTTGLTYIYTVCIMAIRKLRNINCVSKYTCCGDSAEVEKVKDRLVINILTFYPEAQEAGPLQQNTQLPLCGSASAL